MQTRSIPSLLIGKKNNNVRFIFQNIYFTAPAVNPFTIYFCAKNVRINAGTSDTKEPAAISQYLTSYCWEKVAIETGTVCVAFAVRFIATIKSFQLNKKTITAVANNPGPNNGSITLK